jgi:hypothetical protein
MNCRYFDGCSAPLCPKDEGIAERTWFPDEDMCRLICVPEWVKRQRRVSRKAALGCALSGALGCALSGYFTVAMLKRDCRISKGMKGIDPNGTDKTRAADEAAWFTAHPVITEEDREKYKARAEKINTKSLGFQNKKGTNPCALKVKSEERGSEIPHGMKSAE